MEINENVRGKDVFVVQPTCRPTNENLMELVIIVDALRRSSAERITTVVSYFGYSRQTAGRARGACRSRPSWRRTSSPRPGSTGC